MNFLLVYAHPNSESFNHALLRHTRAALEAVGHNVRLHDLYAMGFDPVLAASELKQPGADVAALQGDIAWADRLFFTYPIWWYGRPAILQGYLDRLLSYDFAYKVENGTPIGLLKHDRALVFQTTGMPESVYNGNGDERGDTAIHYPMLNGTLAFCGIRDARVHTFYAVSSGSDDSRRAMLDEAVKLVETFAA